MPGETTLIVGGAGFIGANLADRIARHGGRVLLFDNLSRPGVERNTAWLQASHPRRVELRIGDIRDPDAVAEVVNCATRRSR